MIRFAGLLPRERQRPPAGAAVSFGASAADAREPHQRGWRRLALGVQGRHDSPWYPTVRLLRRIAPGDWCGAIAALVPLADIPPTPERLAPPAFRWT